MKKDNIPEIRMPGFKEEWKHKKFHAVFDYLQNNALPRSALNYESGEIKNIHYGDVLIKFGEYIDVSKEMCIRDRKSSVKMKSRRLTKRTSSMRNTCGRHLGILLPITICSQHGWQREMILM